MNTIKRYLWIFAAMLLQPLVVMGIWVLEKSDTAEEKRTRRTLPEPPAPLPEPEAPPALRHPLAFVKYHGPTYESLPVGSEVVIIGGTFKRYRMGGGAYENVRWCVFGELTAPASVREMYGPRYFLGDPAELGSATPSVTCEAYMIDLEVVSVPA